MGFLFAKYIAQNAGFLYTISMDLQTPIKAYAKLAKVSEKSLQRIGIKTVRDLIFYFPFRYEDLSDIVPIGEIKIGQTVTIKGRVDLINTKRSPRKRMYITECLLSDETGTIKAVWFNQAFIGKVLHQGDVVFLSGQVQSDYVGLQMSNPSYEKQSRNRREGQTIHTGRIVAVYPQTQGLTSRQLRLMMKKCLVYINSLQEWLPQEILDKYELMGYVDALKNIHYPETVELRDKALERLRFDELIIIQLYAQNLRHLLEATPAHEITFHEDDTKQFVTGLGFELTNAQRKAAWDILQDMQTDSGPMNRLLEGDVGSGKTVVAAISVLNTYLNQKQSVILAPTEILAKQHFDSMVKFFMQSGMRIGLLTRGTILYHDTACEETIVLKKKELLEKIEKHDVDCVIGTHALLQDSVSYGELALIIVDEQHRFGVKQRQVLKERMQTIGEKLPHFLSMTATPIPRSLALALYGDLDLSIINQMPVGRKPVVTQLVAANRREEAYNFIRKQIDEGRQCFVVCPLVNKSDKLGVKSVEEEFKRLDQEIFKDLVVEKLHGKLKKDEKAEVMERFVNNEIHILIATSVIEVGVNVPNATVMVIEGAERFGLAQLHQFRGRVGRADYQSHCLLFTDSDSDEVQSRLKKFCEIKDGFKLAELDLDNRGAGDVYGYRQSGASMLQLANLTDRVLIQKVQEAAKFLLEKNGIDGLSMELKQRLQDFTDLVDLE